MIKLNHALKPKRKVYLLLTEFSDTGTQVIKTLTGLKYPHTSIGLEEDMNTFYSFVTKGFIVEKINRYAKPGRKNIPCRLYELNVSEKTYFKIKEELEYFVKYGELFHYSKTNLALSILNLPYKRKQFGFFCSQFVAFILQKSKAIELNKSINKYFSTDLSKLSGMRLKYQGTLKNMMDRLCIQPCLA